MEVDNITPLPNYTINVDPPQLDDYGPHREAHTPLVIDNGATTLRYGFATSSTPRSGTNVVAKYKERKGNKPILVFGDAVEVDTTAKSQIRYPWEGDVLLNFDALVSHYSTCTFIYFAKGMFGDVGERT